MTAKEGRKRSVRVLVAVGNGRGAAGDRGVMCMVLEVGAEDRCGLGSALESAGSCRCPAPLYRLSLLSGLGSYTLW